METRVLHPKVDYQGNLVEEKRKETKVSKRQWREELIVSFQACIVFRVRSLGRADACLGV